MHMHNRAATREMTVMATEKRIPEPVDFKDLNVGDTVTFLTADNGFTGSGQFVNREGIVISKTDKSITVRVVGSNPLMDGWKNRSANLRQADWSRRCVRLVAKADNLPFDAEHVVYADFGHTVEALWTADPRTCCRPQACCEHH